jgi:deaminated glutathione amidase
MNRIAILQMTAGIDRGTNLEHVVEAVARAADGGAVMLFTPEMSNMLDCNRSRAAASIVTEQGDAFITAVINAAARHRIWVSLGSVAVRQRDIVDRFANRSLLIDDGGIIRGRYDKFHMFDVDLPNGESWRESSAYEPGHDLSIVDTPVGRLGLSICYDIRFPALYQSLSEGGAQIIAVPAAFTVPTGKAHWQILLQARAIENACWVIAAAQTGTHEDGRSTYGHSLVINPWGEIVLDMGEKAGLAFAEIDLAEVEAVQTRIPVIAHRRAIPEARLS